jgi:S-methylmethionine-dependent homocysteine/selenocysteine methylase
MARKFPNQQPGLNYLTEGGQETEILYKYGFELPQFAMFPLLDNPRAVTELRGMYGRYLDIAARHGFGVVMGGLDYRASPDWGSLLGYSRESLADMQMRSIDFLREVAQPYGGQVPALMYAGIVGPRGDAYETNQTITAEEAEEYHGEQLATLARAGVDLVEAMTFNGVPEVIGLARAAARAKLPLAVSFTLDHESGRLASGPSLKDAIETIDAQTGDDRPAFYGINCSHPLEFMPAIEPGTWFERVRVLRPNAAMMDKISLCTLGHLETGGSADAR